MMQLRRRALMNKNPERAIKCLLANGAQYIKTEYIPKSTDKITLKYIEPSNLTTGLYVFGTRVGKSFSASNDTITIKAESTTYSNLYFGNSSNVARINHVANLEIEVVVDGVNSTINGSLVGIKAAEFDCKNPLYLFALNNGGTVYKPFKGKIKQCTVERYGSVIHNWIPHNNGGAIGMMDTVNNVFCGNAGSGEFGYELFDGTIVNPT